MEYLRHAQARLRAFVDQTTQLLTCEFPYVHSRTAIQHLRRFFQDELTTVEGFDAASDPNMVKQKCILALNNCFVYLPVLGFLLRSTNVRNAFEGFWPLLRLAQEVLEPGKKPEDCHTKLVLSSEWDYSPLVYPSIPRLQDFVLIGLPAPESENPLMFSLAGHELGHTLWLSKELEKKLRPQIWMFIVKHIETEWDKFQQVFPGLATDKCDLTTDMFAIQAWQPAVLWVLRQAEETFCDFVGLRVFGNAYLSAFAYLLAPNPGGARSEFYPTLRTRVAHLLSAAGEYGVPCSSSYKDLFDDDDAQPTFVPADEFRLRQSDMALSQVVDRLTQEARLLIDATKIVLPSPNETKRIAADLRRFAPAENSASLADILNAAWTLYEDQTLWASIKDFDKKRKEEILRELVLKNIELFEIERRLEAK
jgi:hypothetical protein